MSRNTKVFILISTLTLPRRARSIVFQLFQGKVSASVEASSQAVDLCQRDEDHTPDTEAVGQVGRPSR